MPVIWKSKLTNTVMSAVAHGEYVAMDECSKDMLFVLNVLQSMDFIVTKPMKLYSDNDAARSMVQTKRLTEKSKVIDGRIKHVKELHTIGLLEVKRINSADNIADQFTKPLGPKRFHECVSKMMNGSIIFEKEEREKGGCSGDRGCLSTSEQ